MLNFLKERKFRKIYIQCRPYTMTSRDRMLALYESVVYIVKNNIPGDLVECGVWKGGSAMLMAMTLRQLKVTDRKIYLYDTFEGMTEPTSRDYRLADRSIKARDIWKEKKRKRYSDWCFSPLAAVKRNMQLTGYPMDKIRFVKGKVEKTIPRISPSQLAILRLDTDWYQSTKHELIHLFPVLSHGGVLIIDDYGYWAGSKKAVDEYFSKRSIHLKEVDRSARIGIKI